MPRRLRNSMKASFFHIVVQGVQKKYIFDKDEDKEQYIRFMIKKCENITILAYCVMSNHGHILIKTENIEYMQKWMHKVNTNYAIFYNRKYNREGYVFNDRYFSQEIANVKHLYACMKYIHNNPVKAGICAKPEEYSYSTFKRMYDENMVKVAKNLEKILNINFEECETESIFEKYEVIFEDCEQSKAEICDNFLKEVQKQYNVDIKNIKNTDIFIKIVKVLRLTFKLPCQSIANKVGVGRETIRKLIKENESKW